MRSCGRGPGRGRPSRLAARAPRRDSSSGWALPAPTCTCWTTARQLRGHPHRCRSTWTMRCSTTCPSTTCTTRWGSACCRPPWRGGARRSAWPRRSQPRHKLPVSHRSPLGRPPAAPEAHPLAPRCLLGPETGEASPRECYRAAAAAGSGASLSPISPRLWPQHTGV